MANIEERLGILGGAFDPVHIGHLVLAQSAQEELGLNRILFVPSFAPAESHKTIPTSFQHRYEMVRRALAGCDAFEASEIERTIPAPTYTVTMLEQIRAQQPKSHLILVMGADSLEQLNSWHLPQRIFELAEIAIAARHGHRVDSPYPVKKLNMPLIAISATELRERVRRGLSLRFLVPDAVISYIYDHQLYHED